MWTALIAGVAAVTVAALGVLLPQMSAKHQREVALLEADLASRLPGDSSARQRLEAILASRTMDWERANDRRQIERWLKISWLMLAVSLALAGLDSALHYWLEPTEGLADIRSTAAAVRAALFWAFIGTGVLTLSTVAVAIGFGALGFRQALQAERLARADAEVAPRAEKLP